MAVEPSPAEVNGRDDSGRFATGNRFGRGNPHAQRAQEVRAAFLAAITPQDVEEIARRLVEEAKGGDLGAAREVLLRVLGRPFNPTPGDDQGPAELAATIHAHLLELEETIEREPLRLESSEGIAFGSARSG